MAFVPISTLDTAKEFSEALYKLLRPTSVRDSADITVYLSSPYVDENGNCMLEIPDDFVNISALASNTTLDSLLEKAIADKKATVLDKTTVKAAIVAQKGKPSKLMSFFPVFWQTNAKTKAQIEAEGYKLQP